MSLRLRLGAVLLVLVLSVLAVGPFNGVMAAEDPPVLVNTWGSNGTAEAQFSHAVGVAVDDSGHVYVSDEQNHRLQKFRVGSLETFIADSPLPLQRRLDGILAPILRPPASR